MNTAITIRLDETLDQMLNTVSTQTGQSRSEIVRSALRRQLSVILFEQLRGKTMPFAEAAGYLTDEDIFQDVS
tara:strand:+ start:1092 stop:1310 length:219 start_codon:yes stop_codon:yes gene_type:complete